jgi:uncharacterized RDD family membrane protein YckC
MTRHKTLSIQTPEGIVFPLAIAGVMRRFLALVLDQLCIIALSMLTGMILHLIGTISPDLSGALTLITQFALSIGYPIVFEWYWHGQTPGKKVFRIRVMDVQGLRLTFSQVVVRNLLRLVDAIPFFYLVGGTAAMFNPRGQRIGDFAANTVVVYHPHLSEPDLDQILADKYNSFRTYPHLAARLRQRISPQAAGIMLQALLRRDSLDPTDRLDLFDEIKSYVESLVQFPRETTEGMSNEQYVRNVVDILFK